MMVYEGIVVQSNRSRKPGQPGQAGCRPERLIRIPTGTPIANYRYYVKTAREILGFDPVGEPGWSRMAF